MIGTKEQRQDANRTCPPPAVGVTKTLKRIRAAVYTRQSVADDLAFSSVDQQRESGLAFIESQKLQGWEPVLTRFDDQGFSGGSLDRPAFKRLVESIERKEINAVVVFRLDRLSRSLIDFVGLLEFFQKYGVEFASVCEQFSTDTPVGRFTLSILMGVAQLERENISQRTQAKIMATRRRGLWTGGPVPFGFDLVEKKLVVNEREAAQVKEIFELYLSLGSILAVAEELNRRGWTTKSWTMQSGEVRRGKPFNKITVRNLLANPVYMGKVKLNGELFDGIHAAIVGEARWTSVQDLLKLNGAGCGSWGPSKSGALLLGLINCACGSRMSVHTARKGNRVYRSYVCVRYMKEGAAACPGSRVPAGEMEKFVSDKIREIGKNPRLVTETIQAARNALVAQRPRLETELKRHEKERAKLEGERLNLVDAVANGKGSPSLLQRLGEVEIATGKLESEVERLKAELSGLEAQVIDESDLRQALASFTPIWDQLFPAERTRIIHLLIERVVYDGRTAEVEIVFRANGIKVLAAESTKEAS